MKNIFLFIALFTTGKSFCSELDSLYSTRLIAQTNPPIVYEKYTYEKSLKYPNGMVSYLKREEDGKVTTAGKAENNFYYGMAILAGTNVAQPIKDSKHAKKIFEALEQEMTLAVLAAAEKEAEK